MRLLAGQAAGCVKAAAKGAGIGRTSPYVWARKDENFGEQFEAAKAQGERVRLDELEEEVDRRAKKSDLLLMFRVKRLDPRYRDNAPPFPFAPLGAGVIRMVQVDPDGTERWLEIGRPAPTKGPPKALPEGDKA